MQDDQAGPQSPAQRRDTRRSQGEALRAWAEGAGLILSNEEFQHHYEVQGGEDGPSGGENDIYYEMPNRYWKRNTLYLHQINGWFASFFERTLIHNHLFPESAYRLEGFVDTEEGLLPVLSQPRIKPHRGATRAEVRAYLENRGFQWIGAENYQQEDLYVGDLHNGNAFITQAGHLVIIDPEIRRGSSDEDGLL